MDTHKNAPLTPKGREMMVRASVERGLSKAAAAGQFNITPKTVAKWVRRFRAEGVDGLRDRSSRPLSSPSQTGGLAMTATLTTLVSFNGTDGAFPHAGLIADAAGDLFGTTTEGGAYGNGAVFELVNNGGGAYTPVTLLSFGGNNGAEPFAGLIADAAGDLFGTTASGGAPYTGARCSSW